MFAYVRPSIIIFSELTLPRRELASVDKRIGDSYDDFGELVTAQGDNVI
jgi:hypothetical protein